jgi:predicted hotdog family 3-hydroxylacyl-ACP dehydratase
VSGAALGRAWLEANLPHAGTMNLLDAIVEWDAARLAAVARGHKDPAHPLRRGGELPIACAIEYGAQAAAAHGALLAARPSGSGMLASVREVHFYVERLDDLEADLDVRVEQLGGGEAGVLYRFAVSAAGRALAEGRLTVAFSR